METANKFVFINVIGKNLKLIIFMLFLFFIFSASLPPLRSTFVLFQNVNCIPIISFKRVVHHIKISLAFYKLI